MNSGYGGVMLTSLPRAMSLPTPKSATSSAFTSRSGSVQNTGSESARRSLTLC